MIYPAIIMFLIFEYVRPSIYFPPLDALHLTAIISVFLTITTFFSGKGFSKTDLFGNFNVKTMIFYTALFIISVLAARVHYSAYLTFRSVFGYILAFFFLAKYLYTLIKIRQIFIVLVMIHLFVIVVNLDTITNLASRDYLRAGYFMADGNDFAFSLIIVLPMCVYLYRTSKNKTGKIIYAGILMTFLLGIIATQSRGGSLALAAVVIYFWVHSRKKIVGLALLLLGIIILLAFGSQSYWERMSTIQNFDSEASAHNRILAWKSAMRMAVDYPLTGIGPGGFQTAFGTLYRPPGVGRTDMRWMNVHSIYFKLLSELGFPGLIVLLTFIFRNMLFANRIIKFLLKQDHSVKIVEGDRGDWGNIFLCLNASTLGFAVAGAFLSGIYYPHLYVLVGLITACQMAFSKQQATEETHRVVLVDGSPRHEMADYPLV